jgi:hypothetical protein
VTTETTLATHWIGTGCCPLKNGNRALHESCCLETKWRLRESPEAASTSQRATMHHGVVHFARAKPIGSDSFAIDSTSMEFHRRLKKEMSEGIVRAILEDAGYRVIDSGVEKVLREVACLSADEYARLGLPGAVRLSPDLTVMNREQTETFLIEVKYRKDWSKSLFGELEEQLQLFKQLVVVSINGTPPNPKGKANLPSRHLRCCRARHMGAAVQVELKRRDFDGGGSEWVDVHELEDDNLWWKMSPLQDVFTQVQDRRNAHTLLSGIDALAGIIQR